MVLEGESLQIWLKSCCEAYNSHNPYNLLVNCNSFELVPMIRSYHRFRFRSVERNVHHLCCHSKLKVSAGWYASNHPYPHKAQSTIENISSAGELLTYPGLAIIVQESCVSSDQYSGNELCIISHSLHLFLARQQNTRVIVITIIC